MGYPKESFDEWPPLSEHECEKINHPLSVTTASRFLADGQWSSTEYQCYCGAFYGSVRPGQTTVLHKLRTPHEVDL